MASLSQKFATLALLGLVGGLFALNWRQLNVPIDVAAIPVPPSETQDNVAAATSAAPARPVLQSADVGETLTRPLFQPDRRPKAKAPDPAASAEAATELPALTPEVVEPAASADGFRLAGIMRKGDKDRRALIRTPSSPIAKWIPAGGEIDGWRVDLIGKDRVLLTKGSGETELLLHSASARTDAAGKPQ